MAKDYWFTPGSGDPRTKTGLSPTFIIFQTVGGTAITGPAITEPGASTGLYRFLYGPTTSIVFCIDAGSALSDNDRYIRGSLDPVQAVNETIGQTTDSFGSTGIDPSSVLGYLKRALEIAEGDASFSKATGAWAMYNRGSSTLLRSKTLANNTTAATKV